MKVILPLAGDTWQYLGVFSVVITRAECAAGASSEQRQGTVLDILPHTGQRTAGSHVTTLLQLSISELQREPRPSASRLPKLLCAKPQLGSDYRCSSSK